MQPVAGLGLTGGILRARYPENKWTDNFKKPIILSAANDSYQAWSRIVWYMDKNRPLPPGSAFNPYRKKDDERRKKKVVLPPSFR